MKLIKGACLSCNLGSGVKLFVQFSWSIVNNANCLENQTG